MTTSWTTRGELLTERAARLSELERERYGWRRDVKPGAAMLVAMALSMYVTLAREDDPSTRTTAIWWGITAVAVAALLLVLWQRVRTSRAMDRERLAWAGADRTRDARGLPPGEIPDELLTIFDARDRPDLEEVSSRVGLTTLGRIRDTRLLWPAFRAIPAWCFSVVLLAAGLTSDDAGDGLPLAVVGAIVLVATSTTVWMTWVEAFRRQQDHNGTGYDRQLYAARAEALGGPTAVDPGPVPLAARIAVGVLALAITAALVLRVATASALALLVVLAIFALAALLIAPPLLRRRALHVVPQTTDGGTVLDPPRRRVAVDLVDDAIVIRAVAGDVAPATIPVSDVLTVVDVRLGYPFAPPAVGIVTEQENIVLAGSGVKDLPALAAIAAVAHPA
ncbi:hypothetical protein [Aeromicrobium wangtongii]|uniref:Uncharacterized protein n=1 Tax=Aeromicrobium wangtongii TaxID=2969247 RepID=A0ABY5MD38_9ACTN|nr:hypothetical protein [Aeromicrobium wangtongii]MCD9197094.1 hypothetical protein [Aeromicrobium wangtongii]UUP14593.1 hypothetical protein NQV15_04580 [Aeromicrobium wangtongii]